MAAAPYDPTPDEIAAACAEIQKEWSAYERWRRTVHKQAPTTVSLARLRMPAGWIEPVAGVGGNDW